MKSLFQQQFETIVIGGGFAGSAAAWSAAGEEKTLLLSSSLDTIAHPAWGPCLAPLQSLEKTPAGASFRERVLQPALLGEISTCAGPLVLFDTFALRRRWQAELESLQRLAIYQDTAEALERSNDTWRVRTRWGSVFTAKRVILALGTFLGGRCQTGRDTKPGGRPGEIGAENLRESLEALGAVFVPSVREAAPTITAASIDLKHFSPLSPPGGPVRAFESAQADDRRIILAPLTRAALEFYPYGAGADRSMVDETTLRETRGLKEAKIVTPGFKVEYLKVLRAPNDLCFVGAIVEANDYVSAIVGGLAAGAKRE